MCGVWCSRSGGRGGQGLPPRRGSDGDRGRFQPDLAAVAAVAKMQPERKRGRVGKGKRTDATRLNGIEATPPLAEEGAGYTVKIGPLSAALSSSMYQICELIKTAARWRIMKKI